MAKKPEDVIAALEGLDLLDYQSAVNWPEPQTGEQRQPLSLEAFRSAKAPRMDGEFWELAIEEVGVAARPGEDGALSEVLDVLAWYAPIHTAREDWGIYIRESAVLRLAGRIAARLPGGTTLDPAMVWGALRSAVFCLYHHEAFHHYVESFAIRLELFEGEARYLPYHRSVYGYPGGSDGPLEEGLACADQLRRHRKERYLRGLPREVSLATKSLLEAWIPTLGPGYRQGVDLAADSAFSEGRNRLSSQIQCTSPVPTDDGSRWRLIADDVHEGLCECRSATYLVLDGYLLGRITGRRR
ncbi:MAG: hypothetical protein CL471_12390 [Acidobacteria bacterium]|jgi:hypothetical protein|nr:hypothetical protein [Acidobacteriota bacterium]